MFSKYKRNYKGSLERYFNFIFFLIIWLILFIMLLDGIFFIVMQGYMDILTRKLTSYAAAQPVDNSSGNIKTPDQLAQIKCRQIAEYVQTDVQPFLGFTETARNNFINNAKTAQSFTDREAIKKQNTGCYYNYNNSANSNKILSIYLVVKAPQAWPIFTRGLLEFFGAQPVTLTGRYSATVESTAPSSDEYSALDTKINTSLPAYGVKPILVGLSGGRAAGPGEIVKEGGTVIAPGQTGTGARIGLAKIENETSIPNAPLIFVTMMYKSSLSFSGMESLGLSSDVRRQGSTYPYRIDPSLFIEIAQAGSRKVPNKDPFAAGLPTVYLPLGSPGSSSGNTTYNSTWYNATFTRLDGDRGPLIIRKGGGGDQSEDVSITCSRKAVPKNLSKSNPPMRKGLLLNHPTNARTGDVGPYYFLTDSDMPPFHKPNYNRASQKISDWHMNNAESQNIIDRLMPYTRCAKCGRGSVHCGYFGSSVGVNESSEPWLYKLDIYTVTFDFKTRIFTNTQYTRENGKRFELTCTYGTYCVLQNCCKDNSEKWCKINTDGEFHQSCECWNDCLTQDSACQARNKEAAANAKEGESIKFEDCCRGGYEGKSTVWQIKKIPRTFIGPVCGKPGFDKLPNGDEKAAYSFLAQKGGTCCFGILEKRIIDQCNASVCKARRNFTPTDENIPYYRMEKPDCSKASVPLGYTGPCDPTSI